MLRTFSWSAIALLLGLGLLVTGAPGAASAAPAPVAAKSAPVPVSAAAAIGGPALTSVDDFEFASFDAVYELSRDDDGRSVLRTAEVLVANFPEIDQNRGIRRSLPENYQGHPTDLRILSVTDGSGNAREYDTDSEDDIFSLTIAGDDYVHGQQIYVIEYEQRNITGYFDNTGRDEFYWDVNGLDWAQPFGRVTAVVHLDEGLSDRLTGDMSAVQGRSGQTTPARIEDQLSSGSGLGFYSEGPLGPHQTLTFAIGFEKGTFTPRDESFTATPAPLISMVSGVLAAATAVWAWIIRRTRLRDAPGRGVIVPEYEPFDGVNVLTAAYIGGVTSVRGVPAQIIDLAVRGRLRLLEKEAEGTRSGSGAEGANDAWNSRRRGRVKGRSKGYLVELVDPETPDLHEYRLIQALFGKDPMVGAIRDLAKVGPEFSSEGAHALGKLQKQVADDALTEGLRKPYPTRSVVWLLAIASVCGLAGIIAGAVALDDAVGGTVPLVSLLVALGAPVLAIILIARRPLTACGVEVRDHLRGLKMYIKLAEADRLRMLQSPEGAERLRALSPDGSTSSAQVVHLYERLLPYAVLFGEEKKWAAELGRLYEEGDWDPGWYVGVTAFNAGNFASGFSGVASSLSSAYSSSSSGGSGGASAGGGGGGGGGGGV